MHPVPLDRIREIRGADAVLYHTVKEYGTQFIPIRRSTSVHFGARPAGAAVSWVRRSVRWSNSSVDRAHVLCGPASAQASGAKNTGLFLRPYHREGDVK